jgi:uncharacterized coiled-coil protein SlyX
VIFFSYIYRQLSEILDQMKKIWHVSDEHEMRLKALELRISQMATMADLDSALADLKTKLDALIAAIRALPDTSPEVAAVKAMADEISAVVLPPPPPPPVV